MRWGVNKLKNGEVRESNGFLFLPKKINGETRWLEFARWKEMVNFRYDTSGAVRFHWQAFSWIDDPIPVPGSNPPPPTWKSETIIEHKSGMK